MNSARKFRHLIWAMWLSSCTPDGDRSVAQKFHANVKVGAPIAESVIAGESAQLPELMYYVLASGCPGHVLEFGRGAESPYIKIIEDTSTPEPLSLGAYVETGYATRAAFAEAVRDHLARLGPCKEFLFTFDRAQVGFRSDSFSVRVDGNGLIVTPSPLKDDSLD